MKALAEEAARLLFATKMHDFMNPRCDPTFAEAAGLYMKVTKQTRFLAKLILYFGPETRLSEIDDLAICRAAAALLPGAAESTSHRQIYTPITAIRNFNAGKRRVPHQDGKRTRWLTPEEAERLIAVASDPSRAGIHDPDRQLLKLIVFLLATGVRPGEAFVIDVGDFNWGTRECLIRADQVGAGKTWSSRRWVQFPERAVELIGALPESGRAFLKPNGQPYVLREYGGGQIAKHFARICAAAGLGPEVTPYTLRHTWATWFSAQVGDHDRLLDRGGWAKSDTARRYRKRAPGDLAQRLLDHGWDFRA
ncbi:tyrosine-type recombinase/integrase [Rhodovulum steppense]|nr:tyrosine-type recombinase/integrase [Rhodovulum steppense]